MIYFEDRRTQQPEPEPTRKSPEEGGPTRPAIDRPQLPDELSRRLKNVDKDRAKNYGQRSGQ